MSETDDNPRYAAPSDWTNYGDLHPRRHGGRFLRWEGDGWHMVETRDLKHVGPEGMISDGERYMVQDYYLEPADVWVDGDPSEGFTDAMQGILESLGDTHHVPDGPPFMDRIGYYVADLPFHAGIHARDSYTADYWGYLGDRYEIDPDEIDGCRRD